MNKFLETLRKMNLLISTGKTGDPVEFAKSIDMSERSMYDYLRVLKSLGCPVIYSRAKKTYYYVDEGELKLGFIRARGTYLPLTTGEERILQEDRTP